jgi:hypothetical protein
VAYVHIKLFTSLFIVTMVIQPLFIRSHACKTYTGTNLICRQCEESLIRSHCLLLFGNVNLLGINEMRDYFNKRPVAPCVCSFPSSLSNSFTHSRPLYVANQHNKLLCSFRMQPRRVNPAGSLHYQCIRQTSHPLPPVTPSFSPPTHFDPSPPLKPPQNCVTVVPGFVFLQEMK